MSIVAEVFWKVSMADNSEAKFPCRVCGLEQTTDMWHPRSHQLCACCATEMGLDDDLLADVLHYRMRWLTNGAKWFIEEKQPGQWSIKELTEQLRNIPIEWWYRDYKDKD